MDTYTGHVEPFGDIATRVLDDVEIRKASVSEQDNSAYLVTCRATNESLLIDAPDSPEHVDKLIAAAPGRLTELVITHQHWDHHRAAKHVVDTYGVPVAAGGPDAAEIAQTAKVTVDRELADGDVVKVGNISLDVIALRGHTPGSVALAYTEPNGGPVHLFTGDSLFPGGVGNTFGDKAAFVSLLNDVEERIFARYDDRTWVYPGHGDDTTLGDERADAATWRERGW